jgi:hypothetical protein
LTFEKSEREGEKYKGRKKLHLPHVNVSIMYCESELENYTMKLYCETAQFLPSTGGKIREYFSWK